MAPHLTDYETACRTLRNCRNLEQLTGSLEPKRLRAFRNSRTVLDLESLLETKWPESMETVAIYSGNGKWTERARQILDGWGCSEFFHKN